MLPLVAPKLGPGERVIFEGHPSWRAILTFYIKGILATAVVALIVALISSNHGLVFLIAVVGVAGTILIGFIKRIATSYTITNRRLHIKRGIVSRTIQETRLERVQNVNTSQSALERMLRVGDVDFDTAAGDDYNFVFSGVADPSEVVEKVDEATRSLSSSQHGHGGLGDEEHGNQPPTQTYT